MRKYVKRTLLIVAILTIVLALTSCQWVFGLFNKFWLDELDYEIERLVVHEVASNGDGSFQVDVYMLTGDVDFDRHVSGLYPLDGFGHVVRLTLNSPASDIREGDYGWDPAGGEYTVESGVIVINGSYEDGTRTDEESVFIVEDGTVWVSEALFDNLVIDFELDTIEANTREAADAEGHFRGEYEVEQG
jgi:hypothetical protein